MAPTLTADDVRELREKLRPSFAKVDKYVNIPERFVRSIADMRDASQSPETKEAREKEYAICVKAMIDMSRETKTNPEATVEAIGSLFDDSQKGEINALNVTILQSYKKEEREKGTERQRADAPKDKADTEFNDKMNEHCLNYASSNPTPRPEDFANNVTETLIQSKRITQEQLDDFKDKLTSAMKDKTESNVGMTMGEIAKVALFSTLGDFLPGDWGERCRSKADSILKAASMRNALVEKAKKNAKDSFGNLYASKLSVRKKALASAETRGR
jgi:hypothetical protein